MVVRQKLNFCTFWHCVVTCSGQLAEELTAMPGHQSIYRLVKPAHIRLDHMMRAWVGVLLHHDCNFYSVTFALLPTAQPTAVNIWGGMHNNVVTLFPN